MSSLWAARGDDSANCACLKVNKQWIDEDKNPIEITMSTALYGGDSLLETVPKSIMPDVELHVAVTVHDIKGNVYLDGLTTVQVIPIDNLADELSDVLFVLICLANQTGIDLEKSFQQNLIKKTERDKDRHKSNIKLK